MHHDRTRLDPRLATKIHPDPQTGCWNWQAYCDRRGYGRSSHRLSSSRLAHRIVYELLIGPVPDGLELDHLCRNHGCVNPRHLEPVTHRENVLRGEAIAAHNARKAACHRGHEDWGLTPTGARFCRSCRRVSNREGGNVSRERTV
jgi:hypothetical protein